MTPNDDRPRGWAGDRGWFVVIGTQRGRSSLMLGALRDHPGAYLPSRELFFFEDPNYRWVRGEQFLAAFSEAPPGAALGFKRPEILGRPESPARLAHAMPNARLVAILREPVGRTVSAYSHYVQWAYLPMRPLNDGLRALLDGTTYRRYPHAGEVLDFSRYAAGIERVHRSFAPEQLCVVLDRDLDTDPTTTVQTVLDHVGLDPGVELDVTTPGVNAGTYAAGAEMRVRRAASRLALRRDRSSGLQWVQMTWPRLTGLHALNAVADRIPTGRARGPEALEPDVRARLAHHLAPDVRRLEELLGRHLPGWPA